MMLCFPQVFLLLVVAAFVTPTLISISLIIGLTSWMEVARIIRAEIKTGNHIHRGIASGQHQDWRLVSRSTQFASHREPIHFGQHHIQDDNVEGMRLRHG